MWLPCHFSSDHPNWYPKTLQATNRNNRLTESFAIELRSVVDAPAELKGLLGNADSALYRHPTAN